MDDQQGKQRIIVVLVIVLFLLAGEAMLVTTVLVSPTAAERVSNLVKSVRETWGGTPESPGIADRIGDAGKTVYQSWISPLWGGNLSAKGGDDFAGCVSCHPKYATTARFSTVYMDHPVHAQLGMKCATCHTETAHPRPAVPGEAVCQECHEEVTQKNKCSLCHAPASLPHFYFLGAPREGPVICDTCHPQGVFNGNSSERLVHMKFDGSKPSTCLECHTTVTCKSCHGTSHPANWIKAHGAYLDEGNTTPCTECHTGTWCASRCHTILGTPEFDPSTYSPSPLFPLPKSGGPIP